MKRTIGVIKLFKEMIGMLIYFVAAKGRLVALESNENGPPPPLMSAFGPHLPLS